MVVAAGSEEVLSGPYDSSVVTADRGPSTDPVAAVNGDTAQLVDFDALPPQIQLQVVEMIQKQQAQQQEQTKLGQQQVQDQMNVEQQVQQQQSAPEMTHTFALALDDNTAQQLQLQQQQQQQPQQLQPQQEQQDQGTFTLVVPKPEDGQPIVVDTNQLPAEIRDELLRQALLQGGQQQIPVEQFPLEEPQQPQIIESQPAQQMAAESAELMAAEQVAELLTRMAMNDPQGEQGIDLDDLPPEIRGQVTEFLFRQQLEQAEKDSIQQDQHKRPASGSSDKHQPSGLDTAAQVGGGLLGGLIAGAVGGGYPGKCPLVIESFNLC